MANFVGFIILIIILVLAISAAFSTYIAQNKGRSFNEGLLLGIFLPFIGILIEAMLPTSDKKIAEEMYNRSMMDLDNLEKTKEILIKKSKKQS